jgi:outer membrane lipoprotein SlyB
MRPAIAMLFLLGLSLTTPLSDALAQSSAGRGAVSGAIIGGAVGGRRGAAIGAATGAVAGSRHQRNWHGHYYWRHGQCWVRTSNGRSHPVSHRYCR